MDFSSLDGNAFYRLFIDETATNHLQYAEGLAPNEQSVNPKLYWAPFSFRRGRSNSQSFSELFPNSSDLWVDMILQGEGGLLIVSIRSYLLLSSCHFFSSRPEETS